VDTLIVRVTVVDAVQSETGWSVAPPTQALVLPTAYSVRVKAADPISAIPALRVERLPRNASFVDSGKAW